MKLTVMSDCSVVPRTSKSKPISFSTPYQSLRSSFKHAIDVYLSKGYTEEFAQKHEHVDQLESEADRLRRAIEIQLYTQTLIPESRGDVWGSWRTWIISSI